jgi:hypothetical protein
MSFRNNPRPDTRAVPSKVHQAAQLALSGPSIGDDRAAELAAQLRSVADVLDPPTTNFPTPTPIEEPKSNVGKIGDWSISMTGRPPIDGKFKVENESATEVRLRVTVQSEPLPLMSDLMDHFTLSLAGKTVTFPKTTGLGMFASPTWGDGKIRAVGPWISLIVVQLGLAIAPLFE